MFSFFKSKPEPETAPDAPLSWGERLRRGLAKTRDVLNTPVTELFTGGAKIDAALYEELETILLSADMGVEATQALLDNLRARVRRDALTDAAQLKDALKQALCELLAPLEKPLDTGTHKPFVIMMAGVNGAGKTTTIGKLAQHFKPKANRCCSPPATRSVPRRANN